MKYPYKTNPSNPNGFLKIDDSILKIIGFVNFSSYEQYGLPTIGKLSRTDYSLCTDGSSFRHLKFPIEEINPCSEFNIVDSCRYDFLDRKKHFIYHLGCGVSIIFELHQELLSIDELDGLTKKPNQAILDYFSTHKNIPLITSDNRIVFDLVKAEERKNDAYSNHDFWNPTYLDKKLIERILKLKKDERDRKLYQKSQKLTSNNEPLDFERQEAQTNTFLKGGFVKTVFENEEYNIPLIPLICLQKNFKKQFFEFKLWTWFFDEEPKYFDNKIIEDLFLGSDIPNNIILNYKNRLKLLDNLKNINI